MVGARPVVDGAATELGVKERGYIVADVVLPQVGHESVHVEGNVIQQVRLSHRLVGMGVEDVVRRGGEEYPGSETGIVNLNHVPQVTADVPQQVLNLGMVHAGGGAQDVSALHGLDSGASNKVIYRASADGGSIHSAEEIEGLFALGFLFDFGEQTVAVQVADRRNCHAFQSQRPRHTAPEVDCGQHVFSVGIDLFDNFTQPAINTQGFWLAGGPDVHRAEVGKAAVGIADALDNRQLAFVPVLLDWAHRGMKPQRVGDGNDLLFGDS